MLVIREATQNDAEGKGYVHYQSWNETYTGLMDQDYLNQRSLEKCVDIARKYPERCFVAEFDGKIVGFSCYNSCRDDDMKNAGEVMAIYVLKAYQKMGIGNALMQACLNKLANYQKIVVWVLDTNINAIDYYQHLGFEEDGKMKKEEISKSIFINAIRLVLVNEGIRSLHFDYDT
ncbi:MAG: GNAT family N-acetyltransferase [Bacillota bacterium]